MCGIVGAIAFSSSRFAITTSYINTMRDKLAHRGPDGMGTWVSADATVGLGNRRLAVIDLSPAAGQPMSNEDGTLWVTFNGEIYNHREIRARLEALGRHQWRTDHSDTEIILHAFEEWGIDCLKQFRGMFAIALWDGRRRELWLIRDRIGVKPLYFAVHHDRLVFASEIKALLEDPDLRREVDEEALYHYLSFLVTPPPQTLFVGVRKLPPATWLRVTTDGTITQQRYWEVWDHVTPLTSASEGEIAEALLAELRTSVKLRKVSDVAVGIFLSGGIDSSTIARLFSEGESSPVKTFSVGYDSQYNSYRNEFVFAREIARDVGAAHHELILDVDDFLRFLPRMVYLQDEPIADPVCVPVYYLSELARAHGVTVCQIGEGADELFIGYPGWQLLLSLQRYDALPTSRWAKRLGLRVLELLGRGNAGYYELLRRSVSGLPIFWGGAEAFTHVRKARLLSAGLRSRLRATSSWDVIAEYRARFERGAWELTAGKWMTFLDLSFRLPELLLMRVDKMTMGASLEGREPFLDHRLVEFVFSIPDSTRVRVGAPKYIFKKAVQELIPASILHRAKQGFGVPLREWLMGYLKDIARIEIGFFCRETGYFNPAYVTEILDEGRPFLVWPLLNLALWWKTHIAQRSVVLDRSVNQGSAGKCS